MSARPSSERGVPPARVDLRLKYPEEMGAAHADERLQRCGAKEFGPAAGQISAAGGAMSSDGKTDGAVEPTDDDQHHEDKVLQLQMKEEVGDDASRWHTRASWTLFALLTRVLTAHANPRTLVLPARLIEDLIHLQGCNIEPTHESGS